MAIPTIDDVKGYLGGVSYSWEDAEIQDALDVETIAQARRCNVPAPYPVDLGNALMRRVQRNLSLRSLPLGISISTDGQTTGAFVPRWDAEIKRLEAPYRKLVLG